MERAEKLQSAHSTLALHEEPGIPHKLNLTNELKIRKKGHHRRKLRSKTIAPKQLTKEEHRQKALLSSYMEGIERPKVRKECMGAARPCPWVSCKHHLYLDINPETGSIKLNFPHLNVWEMENTCSLDVADRGGVTLEEVGQILNLTRERIRQVEVRGLIKLKGVSPLTEETTES